MGYVYVIFLSLCLPFIHFDNVTVKAKANIVDKILDISFKILHLASDTPLLFYDYLELAFIA